MKYQLIFWTLFGISLGIDFWGDRQSHSAPAPVFRPIIQEIRTRIPSNLQLRLPTNLPPLSEDVTLYSFILDDDFDLISLGSEDLNTFMVLVSDIPNCQQQDNPLDCTVGIIGVSETTSKE